MWFNKQHRCEELIAHFRCPERYKLTLNVLVACLLSFFATFNSFYWLSSRTKTWGGASDVKIIFDNSYRAVERDSIGEGKVHEPVKGSIETLKESENNYYTFPESLGLENYYVQKKSEKTMEAIRSVSWRTAYKTKARAREGQIGWMADGGSRKEIKYRWNVISISTSSFFSFLTRVPTKERTLHHNGSIATTASGTKTRWSSETAFSSTSSVFLKIQLSHFKKKKPEMKTLNKQTKPNGCRHKGRWWKDSRNSNNYEHVNKHRVQPVTWVLGRARMFVKCGGVLCYERAATSYALNKQHRFMQRMRSFLCFEHAASSVGVQTLPTFLRSTKGNRYASSAANSREKGKKWTS